jgi:hypothetical protein
MLWVRNHKLLLSCILLSLIGGIFFAWAHFRAQSDPLVHSVVLPHQKSSGSLLSLRKPGVGNKANSFYGSEVQRKASAWVLPVKRFSSHLSAETLLEKLQESGFDAYLQGSRGSKGGISYEILIGPKISRYKFKKIQQDLFNKFKFHTASAVPYERNY